MRLTAKATLFSTLLIFILISALLVVSLYSFRAFSIAAAKDHARTAAEIIRVGLTEEMINGVIDKRANLLQRITDVQGLDNARVVRGQHVIDQFGPGNDSEAMVDEIDRRVLASGEPFFQVIDTGMDPQFRATIPYIATSLGNPDCMQCHQVKEGTVLGAVNLTMSLGHMKKDALLTVGAMTAALAIFAVLILLLLRRITRPLVATAEDVQGVVSSALEGEFSRRIPVRSKDEIGQIAADMNQLTAFLERGLRSIRDNVAQLIKCKPSQDTNLLTNTLEMVDGLVDAAHFKQAIEEDESKQEVYRRLGRVLEEEFQIPHYTLYEVSNSKNRMLPVVMDGQSDPGCCHWCDANIMVRSETCRARRTGHLIDGLETPGLCTAFTPGDEENDYRHICIPIIQSGTVGSVVQLIAPPEQEEKLHDALTLINVYLREAAPVIEAKRLMDTLRESTLRDPMTGLHNRRFLEEYSDTIVAGTSRRKSHIAILMLDLDYFKQVNDSHGHDAGDKVIKTMAKILRNAVRSSDLVIRYGGEEFMIILQDSGADHAVAVGEKIRSTVEETRMQVGTTTLHKTISIGVAEFPGDSDTLWQVIKFADVALYQAKERGRNRVVRFLPEMWQDKEEY